MRFILNISRVQLIHQLSTLLTVLADVFCKIVSEITYNYVSGWTINPTCSLAHSLWDVALS